MIVRGVDHPQHRGDESGKEHEVLIEYDGTTLHLELRNLEYPHGSITRDFRINIPKAVGGTTAYVG